jgi:integrase
LNYVQNSSPITFGELASNFLAIRQDVWRSQSHYGSIKLLLERYAAPLADMLVSDITPDHIEAAVRAAKQRPRTLGAIRCVFNLAMSRGYRTDNPADHRIMKERFPNGRKLPNNFKAMHFTGVPDFMQRLKAEQPRVLSASAIAFLVLTAARAQEVARMQWQEVNLEAKVWTIPAERTKTGQEHRVPLSNQAVELLEQNTPWNGQRTGPVWRSRRGRPISTKAMYLYLTRRMKVPVTIHGFRASFSSWCYDVLDAPEELVEKCLGHQFGKIVSAYRRTDALERRRVIMQAWAQFCSGS